MTVTKNEKGRWCKPCPECKVQQKYLRKNYAEESLRLGKLCKKCSNNKTENCHRGWYRGIRISWFNKFKISAETRGLVFSITLDDVADLMEEQDFKCSLTGFTIEFPESGSPSKSPASIDRIDSSIGYTKENIQLVTKHINMMKQQYNQDYFIQMCKAVALYRGSNG